MTVLPFALAALFVLWASFVGIEYVGVSIFAILAPLLALVGLCFGWKRLGLHTCRSVRARRVNALVGLVCVTVFVSVPTTQWPFRLAYALSRPSLDALALSLKSGVKYSQPLQAGLFSIEKAEIYNGQVCLWTDASTGGGTGFTQCPPNSLDSTFNLWSSLSLDSRWSYVSED